MREHVRLARLFAAWVDADPRFERVAPVPFSAVCFRVRGAAGRSAADADALTEQLMHRVNETGEVFLSHTKLDGRFVLRLAIGHYQTAERHVDRGVGVVAAGASSAFVEAGLQTRLSGRSPKPKPGAFLEHLVPTPLAVGDRLLHGADLVGDGLRRRLGHAEARERGLDVGLQLRHLLLAQVARGERPSTPAAAAAARRLP